MIVKLECEQYKDLLLIKILGNLNVSFCKILKERLLEFILEGKIDILVDLTSTESISKMALGVLEVASLEFNSIGGKLVVAYNKNILDEIIRRIV